MKYKVTVSFPSDGFFGDSETVSFEIEADNERAAVAWTRWGIPRDKRWVTVEELPTEPKP